MSSKVRMKQLVKALEAEERKLRDQVVHLNGQIMYNQRMQETLNQQLREIIAEEDVEKPKVVSGANKSKSSRKSRK